MDRSRAGLLGLLGMFAVAVAGCSQLNLASGEGAQLNRIQTQADGIVVPLKDHVLKLQVCSPDIVRVMVARDASFFSHPSFTTGPMKPAKVDWKYQINSGMVTLATASLMARVDSLSGNVTFLDSTGKKILAEKSRQFTPAEVQGEQTFHVRQQWQANEDEGLYGLGQHQFGLVNLKGYDFDLWQHNTEIAVPMLVSSKGYGVFWDNPSYTKFGDVREFEPIPTDHLLDSAGQPGGLTATTFSDNSFATQSNQQTQPAINIGGRGGAQRGSMRWEGEVLADTSGDYQFALYANGGYKLWIDDKLVADHWRQNWLPWNDLAKVHFDANTKHRLKLEWSRDQGTTCKLTWKTPNPDSDTSLWSQVGDGIDYYFIYGPSLDKVVAGYRQITGDVPMMPIWAFGLWQSKQRYQTQQESLDVVNGFRSRKIPFDNIVQDWFYWRENAWGSHEFDPARFPDPDGWVKSIHDQHAHLMISVWGKFYPGTDNFAAMHEKGFLYEQTLADHIRDWVGRGYEYVFYDAFNPDARKLFWQQVNERLFSKGIDAWWMDATEPDLMPSPPTIEGQLSHMQKTAAGTGARVLNAYPMLNSKGVYEGQRSVAPDQRVFILTRNGYGGEQHYGAAAWSGDISSSWSAMKKQIAAGLGYSISGLPYWTMDCGGFTAPQKWSSTNRNAKPEDIDEWRELNARWFEFATFVPLLRVHGESAPREMWQFGGDDSETYKAQLKFDRLRYRLLPYVYSLAGQVTQNNATFMRPLVMDFPDDKTARDLNDEYLFGREFLVSPVTTYKSRSRSVYLPKGADWHDFWTGQQLSGGQTIDAAAPFDQMPLHVRAGSIIPTGPEIQYTGEKKADPITLYVYAGADADFTLYEDDGLTYGYEKGQFARIPLHWNDASQTLTIGQRDGSFAGMLADRTFQVVLISKSKPVAFSFDPHPDRSVQYHGDAVQIRME